jgi:hypothetical protein
MGAETKKEEKEDRDVRADIAYTYICTKGCNKGNEMWKGQHRRVVRPKITERTPKADYEHANMQPGSYMHALSIGGCVPSRLARMAISQASRGFTTSHRPSDPSRMSLSSGDSSKCEMSGSSSHRYHVRIHT